MADVSIKKNAIANFAGQLYSALIGIFMVPFYLRYLGAESYGLVVFFGVLNSWLCLFDLGLSPALSREIAAARGGGTTFQEFRKLLHSVEIFFFFLCALILILFFVAKDYFARSWLQIELLSYHDVAYCFGIMCLIACMRWFISIYRSGIIGIEEQVWLNGATSILATIRFIGAYLILRFLSREVVAFFHFQLIVSVLELFFISIKFYSLLPGESEPVKFLIEPLQRIASFAGGIAFVSVIWIVNNQLDKILLSSFLPLKDYAYLGLATMVANVINTLSAPMSQALLPRMTCMVLQNRKYEMLDLYLRASKIVSIVTFPLVLTIAIFSKELLFFWTGDSVASTYAGPILSWYALGNGIVVLVAFQYFLQFAHGKVKLHVVANLVSIAVTVPVVYFAVSAAGALGAGIAWFLLNLLGFLVYVPIVHQVFAPGIHFKWLKEVLSVLLLSIALLLPIKVLLPNLTDLSRISGFFLLLMLGLAVLSIVCFSFKETRIQIKNFIFMLKKTRIR